MSLTPSTSSPASSLLNRIQFSFPVRINHFGNSSLPSSLFILHDEINYEIFKAPRCDYRNIISTFLCLCLSVALQQRKKSERLIEPVCNEFTSNDAIRGERSYMLISGPPPLSLILRRWQGGEEGFASSPVCALLWLGTATRESDVMVPAALYSEPGSGRMDGGRREGGGREKMKCVGRKKQQTERKRAQRQCNHFYTP